MAITAEKTYNMISKWNMTATIETLTKTIGTDGSVTEGTTTDTTVYIAPPVVQRKYNGDTLKQDFDCMTVVSSYGLSITFKQGLRLTFDSEEYTINEIGKIYAQGGNVVAYELGLKK